MTLVAGSYERFIWGFALKTLTPKSNESADDDDEGVGSTPNPTLKSLFSYPAHAGPIKCCAVSGPIAVSGGADDTIKVYDLSASTEIGSVVSHAGGAVTAVAFYTPQGLSFPRNLVAGSDDGHVSIYDADPFVHLKSVKVHKKAVVDLAVHPSGRVGLTVGRDAGLALVNLVRGRTSFRGRLDKGADLVSYGVGGGDRFFLGVEEKVSVHDSEDAKVVLELVATKRILCIAPGENGLLFTGGEDRSLTAWDTSSGKTAYCIEDAHPARIKGLVVMGSRNIGQPSDDPYLLASASSDGSIRVWDVRMVGTEKPTPLVEINTNSRLTCLAGNSIR